MNYLLNQSAQMVSCVVLVTKNKKEEGVQDPSRKMLIDQNFLEIGNVVDVVRASHHFHLNHVIRQTSNVSTVSRKVNRSKQSRVGCKNMIGYFSHTKCKRFFAGSSNGRTL